MGNGFKPRVVDVSEFTSPRLHQELAEINADDPALGRATALFHDRNAKTLLALLFPVLGMVTLLAGGYRRSGFTIRIVLGVLMMAGLDSFRGATKTWVSETPSIWFVNYLSIVACFALILTLLWMAGHDMRKLNPFAKQVLK